MSLDPHGPVMDVKQMSKYLGVHFMSVYRLCKQNKIPHFRLGGHGAIRTYKRVLDEWIEREMRWQ